MAYGLAGIRIYDRVYPWKIKWNSDAMSRLCKYRMLPKSGIIAAILTHKPITTEQYNLIAKCHNTTVGHGGVQRTLRNLKKSSNIWLGMRDAVKTFTKNCPCCQKMSAMKYPLNAYRYTTSTYKPMECLNIDFIGPFPNLFKVCRTLCYIWCHS